VFGKLLIEFHKLILELKKKQIIRYYVIGSLNTFISILSFSFLYYIGFHYFIANSINLIIGITISYNTHKKFTFSSKGNIEKYIYVALSNFVLSSSLLHVSEVQMINIYLANIVIILGISLLNYFLIKKLVYTIS